MSRGRDPSRRLASAGSAGCPPPARSDTDAARVDSSSGGGGAPSGPPEDHRPPGRPPATPPQRAPALHEPCAEPIRAAAAFVADLSPVRAAARRSQGMRRVAPLVLATLALSAFVAASSSMAGSPLPVTDPTVPAARDADPVVLTGADFPGWAVSANVTAKLPVTDLTGDPITNDPPQGSGCTTFDAQCAHNHYAKPDFDSQDAAPQHGVPVGRI